MRELIVACEGLTEQRFCRQVLEPHLLGHCQVLVGTRDVRGITTYARLKTFVMEMIKSRKGRSVRFTSLLDLYALPGDFPGKSTAVRNAYDPWPYAAALERAFAEDIGDDRFIPHLQLHEYEAMLFADHNAIAEAFENCGKEVLAALKNIAAHPERIDDGPSTSPSKRIIGQIPAYEGRKTSAGPDIAKKIGIPTIRAKCPHFDAWLSTLESLDWER